MPDQNLKKGDPKEYPALSQMCTADLKRLLARELASLDDAAPDTAFLEAIVEVIKEKEAGTMEEIEADAEGAWQELQDRIANGLEEEIPGSTEPQSAKAKKRPRHLWVLRGAAAIVIIFLTVCGTASVFGVNAFQTVAQWTADTFHFVVRSNSDPVQEDPYAELRSAVAELTDAPVIPNWAPEGTVMEQDVVTGTLSYKTCLSALYHTEYGVFTVCVDVHNKVPFDSSNTYQKDDREVVIVEAGGVTHYIVHNNAKCGVIWINGPVEASIQGDLTVEELEKLVRSIYE